jgi:hypothetical protein
MCIDKQKVEREFLRILNRVMQPAVRYYPGGRERSAKAVVCAAAGVQSR